MKNWSLAAAIIIVAVLLPMARAGNETAMEQSKIAAMQTENHSEQVNE